MRRFMSSEITRDIGQFWKYPDVKKWIAKAIERESIKPNKSLWRNAPTAEQTVDFRISAIRRLQRKRQKPGIDSIIARLTNCSRETRCFSAACAECGRLFQRAFVRATGRYIRDNGAGDNSELVAVTIIPTDGRVPLGKLRNFDIQNFVRRIKQNLKCTNIEVGIGAVDFSFNEDQDGRYEAHWCAHVHIIGWTSDSDQLRAELKRHFPRDGIAIQRPTNVKMFDGTKYGISYRYKIEFDRRLTYYDEKRRRRDTAYPGMTSDQKVELALHLHKAGMGSRLILHRLKAYASRGRLKLKRVGP